MKSWSFSSASARARFCTVTIGTSSSAPEADLASTPVASGLWRAVVTMALTANAAAERRNRADIVRIGDLVEHQHDALLRQRIDVRRGQRIGLGQQALMHGVRTKPPVDHIGPHDFRGHAGVDMVVGQAPGGVFGQPQLADLALRIGQRRRHRVPAIEDDRPVRAGLAIAPGWPAAGFAAFFGLFAGSTLEARPSIAFAHGKLVSRVPGNGNLAPAGLL
jgi:hypothetical protein